MHTPFENTLRIAGRTLRNLGPYLLLEIVMPGGTMIATLLFFYRRHLDRLRAQGQEPLVPSIVQALAERMWRRVKPAT